MCVSSVNMLIYSLIKFVAHYLFFVFQNKKEEYEYYEFV